MWLGVGGVLVDVPWDELVLSHGYHDYHVIV